MSATWGDDPRQPILIYISVAQKQRILEQTARLLVEFDLTCGDFRLKQVPYIWYRVVQHPDLIHPRELTTVPEEVS